MTTQRQVNCQRIQLTEDTFASLIDQRAFLRECQTYRALGVARVALFDPINQL